MKDQRRTDIVCFWLLGTITKDRRKNDVKARGFQVNTKQRGTNEQQEGKNAKRGGEKLRKRKLQSAKLIMNSVWKIHEVVRGKGPKS